MKKTHGGDDTFDELDFMFDAVVGLFSILLVPVLLLVAFCVLQLEYCLDHNPFGRRDCNEEDE